MENTITKTAFDLITFPVQITTERLNITDVYESDKALYAELYKDDELNRYYGYDYREDLKGENPTPDYFYNFFRGLKAKKEEYSLAVRLGGVMIGEIVLYTFSAWEEKTAEIGFRFFREHQKKGYARESVSAVLKFMKDAGFIRAKCKCYKENLPSFRLITALGFRRISSDEKYFYFEKTL